MSKVIKSFMVKCAKSDKMAIGPPSFKWALASRGTLYVTEDALVFKNWKKKYSDIDEALLVRAPWLWTHSYMLMIRSGDGIHQFGLNPNKYWDGDLLFQVRREEAGTIGMIYNIIRIIVYAVLAYLVFAPLFRGEL